MKTVLIFDQAESSGGAFSRAVELSAEIDDYHYIFFTFKKFSDLYSGKLPKKFETVRIFSPFNPHHAQTISKNLSQKKLGKIIFYFLCLNLKILLKINKIFVLTQTYALLFFKKIDLVQANNGIHYVPYRLSKLKKSKIIYYFRDIQYFTHLPREVINRAFAYIFVGHNLQKEYLKELNLDPQKCHVIHSPFNAEERLKHEPNLEKVELIKLKGSGKKIIICSSRICYEKGQHVILDAFIKIHQKHNNAVLIFLGAAAGNNKDQKYQNDLREKVGNENIQSKVMFLGHRNDPLHILQFADIAVQAPTYYEALSGSLVEALQLGITTISSDIGGANEVIIPAKTGFLFTANEPEELAKIFAFILENNHQNFGAFASQYAKEKWSNEKISNAMRVIYSTGIKSE